MLRRRGKPPDAERAEARRARAMMADIKSGKFQLPKELADLTNG